MDKPGVMASENWGIYYILKMLFKIVIIFHNVSVFTVILINEMQPLWVLETAYKNVFKNPTDPKFLNGKCTLLGLAQVLCLLSQQVPGNREKSLDDRSSVEDSESVKDLGETTDLLNLVGEAYYYLLKKHACL